MHGVKPISPWQFAVFRILLGLYLVLHFALQLADGPAIPGGDPAAIFTHQLLPNPLAWSSTPGIVTAWLVGMLVLSMALTLGLWRRLTCLLLWYGWACLFNRDNVVGNPSILFMGVTLLLTALVPPGEPLSVHPRRAGWSFPWIVFVAGWAVLAIGYGFAGLDKLLTSTAWREGNTLQQTLAWATVSLEVLFPVLLVTRRTRLVAWTVMLVVQLVTLAFGASADLTFGAVMLQLFVFDAEWLPARQPAVGRSVAFYDGVCVLCHASVRLLLEEDRRRVLAFAQLQGETFETIREAVQAPDDLDSLLYVQGVGTDTVNASVRSQAVLEILRDIGGFWRVVSWLRIVPRPLRDGVYRIIAKNRYKWFGRHDACRLPTAGDAEQLLP